MSQAQLDYGEMINLLKDTSAGYVVMHMLDRPKTMQRNPDYHDVVEAVGAALLEVKASLQGSGISEERVIYDPGIGFGKTLEHNMTLMSSTRQLADRLERPLLMGISRKSWNGQAAGPAFR